MFGLIFQLSTEGDNFLPIYKSFNVSFARNISYAGNPTSSTSRPTQVAEIFYSYSHKDEALRDELEAHLASLNRSGGTTVRIALSCDAKIMYRDTIVGSSVADIKLDENQEVQSRTAAFSVGLIAGMSGLWVQETLWPLTRGGSTRLAFQDRTDGVTRALPTRYSL